MRQRKDMIPIPPAKEPWSEEDYRNETANLIGRQLCLNPFCVRRWMDAIDVYSLYDILKRFSEEEIMAGAVQYAEVKKDE